MSSSFNSDCNCEKCQAILDRSNWFENQKYGDMYLVEFTRIDGKYVIVCHSHPDNPFDQAASKCHLYSNGTVCVAPGREPYSLEVAEAIAHYWMLGYSEYVRTGEFPDHGASIEL